MNDNAVSLNTLFIGVVAVCFALLGPLFAQDGPSVETPEEPFIFELSTIAGELRYDIGYFRVATNAEVQIRFTNNDAMIHNVVVCEDSANVLDIVGELALDLGQNGMKMQFVPTTDLVLWATDLVYPGEVDTLAFTAPEEAGNYPFVCTFPGHAQTMRGTLQVRDDPSVVDEQFRWFYHGVPYSMREPYLLNEVDAPTIMRVNLRDAPPRTITVGLPQKIHYAFDAEQVRVLFGWQGNFLDVGPDRGWGSHRGGATCEILGDRFSVGVMSHPLRIGNANRIPGINFKGYVRQALPTFTFSIDGVEASLTVHPQHEPPGLTYEYKITDPPDDLYFLVNTSDVQASSDAGSFDNGVLRIEKSAANHFHITITPVSQPKIAVDIEQAQAVEELDTNIELTEKYLAWPATVSGLNWEISVEEPGKYAVYVSQSMVEFAHSGYKLAIAEQDLVGRVHETGSWERYLDVGLGAVEFEKPGKYLLKLILTDARSETVMRVSGITFKKRGA